MRDPERIDLMTEELRKAWHKYPDWRLGQLIANAVRAETGVVNCDPFFIEDDEMLVGIQRTTGGKL